MWSRTPSWMVIAGVAVIAGACGGGGSASLRLVSVGPAAPGQSAPAPGVQGAGGAQDASQPRHAVGQARARSAQPRPPVRANPLPVTGGTPHLPPIALASQKGPN
jgi:hypothetical protein